MVFYCWCQLLRIAQSQTTLEVYDVPSFLDCRGRITFKLKLNQLKLIKGIRAGISSCSWKNSTDQYQKWCDGVHQLFGWMLLTIKPQLAVDPEWTGANPCMGTAGLLSTSGRFSPAIRLQVWSDLTWCPIDLISQSGSPYKPCGWLVDWLLGWLIAQLLGGSCHVIPYCLAYLHFSQKCCTWGPQRLWCREERCQHRNAGMLSSRQWKQPGTKTFYHA